MYKTASFFSSSGIVCSIPYLSSSIMATLPLDRPNVLLILCLSVLVGICNATTYNVGDSSGWDISSNLDSWPNGKSFLVGDILSFQYSSTHSVTEVKNKASYDSCNTASPVQTSTGGNTTIPLTKPGTRYFVCGNSLHCLAGMKMSINVAPGNGTTATGSPASAPQLPPSLLLPPPTQSTAAGDSPPQHSSNNNNSPTSTGFVHYGGRGRVMIAFSALVVAVSLLVV